MSTVPFSSTRLAHKAHFLGRSISFNSLITFKRPDKLKDTWFRLANRLLEDILRDTTSVLVTEYLINRPRKRSPKKDSFVKLRISSIVWNGYTESRQFSQSFEFAEEHASDIAQHIKEYAPSSGGLLVVTIEGIRPWLRRALQTQRKTLPEGLLEFFGTYQRASYGKAVLPTFSETDIEFAIEHLDTPNDEKRREMGQAVWTPLATWCCMRDFLPTLPDLPVIFVMSDQNISIHARLARYYSEDDLYRFERLKTLPYWIFVDLFPFTNWDRIWITTVSQINRLRDEVYGDKAALPILEQTRALHRYKETIIVQKECLRVHVAFVDAYKNGLEPLKAHRQGPGVANLNLLIAKIAIIEEYLAYHQFSSERHLRAMEDLLGISFNLETVKQGLQLKRLNYLAVVFLPLALVAAIFGMNNTVLKPESYGRYAILALLGTIFVAFSSGKVFSWCEGYHARRARAKEARVLDEESSGSYSVPVKEQRDHRQRSQNHTCRSDSPTSIIAGNLWPHPRQGRDSGLQWKQRNGIPAAGLQPPTRVASERERSNQHRDPIDIFFPPRVRLSNSHRRTRSESQIKATQSRLERSRDRKLAERQWRYCEIDEERRSQYPKI
ncbi:hypothetical protein DL98DRAFT_609853 [Cadophora sp. DSE1049]|nr:hypothetical protein DL98DRAFT_609853 [Cadophora sp. DSE1049]